MVGGTWISEHCGDCMNSAGNSNKTGAPDQVLTALTQALEEIARASESRATPADQEFEQTAERSQPSPRRDTTSAGRPFAFGRAAVLSSIALLAVACIAALLLVSPSSDERTASSTSALSEAAPAPVPVVVMDKQPVTTQGVSPAQIVPERAEHAVSIAPELLQALERRLTNSEQEIEQIKASQARLARESSELASSLKEAQEKIVLLGAELASQLRAAEETATRERQTTAEQRRADQDQLAKISEQLKSTQEQIDRLNAGRQQGVARLAPPQPRLANPPAIRRPAPKPASPQARAISQPPNASRSQPRP